MVVLQPMLISVVPLESISVVANVAFWLALALLIPATTLKTAKTNTVNFAFPYDTDESCCVVYNILAFLTRKIGDGYRSCFFPMFVNYSLLFIAEMRSRSAIWIQCRNLFSITVNFGQLLYSTLRHSVNL